MQVLCQTELTALGEQTTRLDGGEALTQGVLAHGAGLDELEEVVRPAGLGPHTGEAVAAEGLAPDHRAGDRAADVDFAGPWLAGGQADGGRRSGYHAGGQGELGVVGQGQRLVEGSGSEHTQDRTEDLLP